MHVHLHLRYLKPGKSKNFSTHISHLLKRVYKIYICTSLMIMLEWLHRCSQSLATKISFGSTRCRVRIFFSELDAVLVLF